MNNPPLKCSYCRKIAVQYVYVFERDQQIGFAWSHRDRIADVRVLGSYHPRCFNATRSPGDRKS